MSEITILHLSDIHFKKQRDDKRTGFRQEVQEKLMESVSDHIKEHGAPDFAAVTGDIAFSGKKPEYDEALKLFEKLKGILPKETEFLVVPGNHDVDRDEVEKKSFFLFIVLLRILKPIFSSRIKITSGIL